MPSWQLILYLETGLVLNGRGKAEIVKAAGCSHDQYVVALLVGCNSDGIIPIADTLVVVSTISLALLLDKLMCVSVYQVPSGSGIAEACFYACTSNKMGHRDAP